MSGLPEPVQRFIADHIASVAQLEALLLLREHPDQVWTPERLSKDLYLDARMTAVYLADWQARGLLALGQDEEPTYRYSPRTAELDELAAMLATMYKERRVSVITAIYAKPLRDVQTFADAFRLRKER